MASIFVSYRQKDASGHAGRLYDRLVGSFGEANVFKDVDSMEPGADYVEMIEETVAKCDALIAVIGPHWLGTEKRGKRRLDDPRDWVRLEIVNALDRGIRVIPVLVDGASMPSAADLPDGLRRFARRHAIQLDDRAWNAQLGQLIEGIRTAVETPPKAPPRADGDEPAGASDQRAREPSEAARPPTPGPASGPVTGPAPSAPRDVPAQPAPPAAPHTGSVRQDEAPVVPRTTLVIGAGVTMVVVAIVAMIVLGAFDGSEGSADRLPRGAVARIGTSLISKATFDHWRRIATKSNPDQSATASRLQTMQFLVLQRWVALEAAERGVHITPHEYDAAFRKAKRDTFKNDVEFGAFLRQSGMLERDSRFQVDFDTLYTRLREDAMRGAKTATARRRADDRFNRELRSKWRARTICASGYPAEQCARSVPVSTT